MIITIQGKKGEGKTSLVKKICKGKKVSFIEECSLKSPFWVNQMDKNTELIVVDNIKHYNDTYGIFRKKMLIINRRSKEPINVIPNISEARGAENLKVSGFISIINLFLFPSEVAIFQE